MDVALIAPIKSEAGSGSQRRHHGLRVPVVQNELIGILREARGLLFRGLVEALLIQLDAQRSRKKNGAVMQRFRIEVGIVFYFVKVSVRARAVQAGLIQVLRRLAQIRPACCERRNASC